MKKPSCVVRGSRTVEATVNLRQVTSGGTCDVVLLRPLTELARHILANGGTNLLCACASHNHHGVQRTRCVRDECPCPHLAHDECPGWNPRPHPRQHRIKCEVSRSARRTPKKLLTPQIQLAESLPTRNSFVKLALGVQYMLGARWRTKTECVKIHYRAGVGIKV